MELKEKLTRRDVQSILRMSELSDVCNNFKMYHFAIVDQLEEDMEGAADQEILDQHVTKVMELIERIGKLVKESLEAKRETIHEFATSRSSKPDTIMTKDRQVDREVHVMKGSVKDIKGDFARGKGADIIRPG